MAKLTKKQKAAAAIVDSHKLYDIDEAVKLVKEAASAKFDETVEVAFNLNINPKYADQQLRGATVLPAGTGKSKKVLVFAKDHKEDEAKAAGAAVVSTGRSDYPNQINNVLVFPGIFRGALDAKAKAITEEMKIAAAKAIASIVTDEELNEEYIIPGAFDERVAKVVAKAVSDEAKKLGIVKE